MKKIEKAALASLGEHAKFYFCAGAETEDVPRENEEALQRYKIVPKVLRDVSNASLKCRILNRNSESPIGVAPTGFHFLAHKEAEIATAKGCAREQSIFIMSSVSSTSIEDVAKTSTLWMQTYITKDRDITLDLIRRAESNGFSAIVVTLDSPVSGQWKNNLPEGFAEITKHRYKNIAVPMHTQHDASLTFADLEWLKNQTKLPIVAKGILNGEDAIAAAQCGVAAIYVSNHGQRQIQKVVPTIQVLEEVVEAVGEYGIDVYFDGGIRSGSDAFIALALGAKAVFIGRPAIWGLTLEGEDGVSNVLHILKNQLLSTMQLAGVQSIEDIKKQMVRAMQSQI